MVASALGGCAIHEDGVPTVTATAAPKERAPSASTDGHRRPAMRIDPRTLVFLDENQVRLLLGDPGAVWDVAPSRVWRYTAGLCSLDLFFYLDLGSSRFRILSYTVSTSKNSNDEKARQRCVGHIQEKFRRLAKET
jgi:hypothetical protein